jgi:NMD protein affecting ribosome stability and mRNA decay
MMIAEYQCPDCGATSDFTPDRCCDNCILKFYFENVNASNFADWVLPENEEVCDECGSVHDQDEDEAMTIKEVTE